MIGAPAIGECNGKRELQMFRVHCFIGYNKHDLGAAVLQGFEKQTHEMFTYEGLSSSNPELVRPSRCVCQDF